MMSESNSKVSLLSWPQKWPIQFDRMETSLSITWNSHGRKDSNCPLKGKFHADLPMTLDQVYENNAAKVIDIQGNSKCGLRLFSDEGVSERKN